MALRVPTANVSLVDLAVELGRPVTVADVNGALKAASEGGLKGIMAFCEEELVSVDFTSSPDMPMACARCSFAAVTMSASGTLMPRFTTR